MADNQDNTVLQAGASKGELSPDSLAPNNYLTIMWKGLGDTKSRVTTLKIDIDKYKTMNSFLEANVNTTKTSGLYKIINNKYLNLGSVAKYFAQSAFDSYGARQAVTGLINILEDGKIQEDNVLNAFLYYSGDLLKGVAKDFGINDINPLIQQLAGQSVLSSFSPFKFLEGFCRETKDWTDKAETSLNQKGKWLNYSGDIITNTYDGLLLGITESDTHSIEIDIPRKRTESGYNYTSHVIVNPFKKDLKLRLTNKAINYNLNNSDMTYLSAIEEVKNIEEVRTTIENIVESKTRFDIYLKLSDRQYKCYTDLMFSSLAFDKTSSTGLSYDFNCTIEPVYEYIPKTYVFTPPASSTKVKGNGSTAGNKSRTSRGKSNSVSKPIQKPTPSNPYSKLSDETIYKTCKKILGMDPTRYGLNSRGMQEQFLKRINNIGTKDKGFDKYVTRPFAFRGYNDQYISKIDNVLFTTKRDYGKATSKSKPPKRK